MLLVSMLITLGGALVILLYTLAFASPTGVSIGQKYDPSCTVGFTGASAPVTIQGWSASHRCDAMVSQDQQNPYDSAVKAYLYRGTRSVPCCASILPAITATHGVVRHSEMRLFEQVGADRTPMHWGHCPTVPYKEKENVSMPVQPTKKALQTRFSKLTQRLQRLRGQPQPLRQIGRLLRILGPGLITGAADDDPSGIGTYSQAGAAYGSGLLWLALWMLPLMIAVQEMCAHRSRHWPGHRRRHQAAL
jgi:hypothetical protein